MLYDKMLEARGPGLSTELWAGGAGALFCHHSLPQSEKAQILLTLLRELIYLVGHLRASSFGVSRIREASETSESLDRDVRGGRCPPAAIDALAQRGRSREVGGRSESSSRFAGSKKPTTGLNLLAYA